MTQPDADSTRTRPDVTTTYGAIPQEMRDRPQWVAWSLRFVDRKTGARLAKPTKVPLGANGRDANHATNRRAFVTALAEVDGARVTGVGYSVMAEDPFVILDMDHVLDADTGEVIETHALAILDILEGSYYRETSPSGDGLRLVVRGKMPGGLRSKKSKLCEVYGDMRFLTMTGWEPSGEVREAPPGSLEQILHEFCGWDGHGLSNTTEIVPISPDAPSAFQMVAEPMPPPKLFQALEADPKLKATWEGKRSLNGDDSATEASLAALLEGYDFKDQEIVDTCRRWRMTHSAKPEKAKERRLYGYLLALVKRDATIEAGQQALEDLETSDVTGESRRLGAVLALNQKLNLAPETGIEGLWEFPGDPPTYAVKAVGQPPMTLGPPKALNSCAEFFALLHPLFGKHYALVKGPKWGPICNALMDSRVRIVVPEAEPGEEMTAHLAAYLEEFPPVGKGNATDFEEAHKTGAPLTHNGVVVVNARHIHETAPEHMRRVWRTPGAVGRTLAGMGLEKHEVSYVRRKRNYWESPISAGIPVLQT